MTTACSVASAAWRLLPAAWRCLLHAACRLAHLGLGLNQTEVAVLSPIKDVD
jgi:hypothetical protein